MTYWMTVPEVAEALRLSESAVYRLLNAGALPGSKFGGSWRVRRDDVFPPHENDK